MKLCFRKYFLCICLCNYGGNSLSEFVGVNICEACMYVNICKTSKIKRKYLKTSKICKGT